MNNALGLAGISLGLVACVGGIVSQLIGLKGGRPERLVYSRGFALMAFIGAVVAVAAMQRALITNDTTVRFVAEQRRRSSRPSRSKWPPCGARSRARSCCGP